MGQLRLGLPTIMIIAGIIMILPGNLLVYIIYGDSLGTAYLIVGCTTLGTIPLVIGIIINSVNWIREINRVDLKPRVIINPPSNKSTTEEDIIVICPHCDEEVNVGTDEDDLYECPHCSEEFEF